MLHYLLTTLKSKPNVHKMHYLGLRLYGDLDRDLARKGELLYARCLQWLDS